MKKYLLCLIQNTPGEGIRQVLIRKTAKEDAAIQNYGVNKEQVFLMDEMSPGELVMFMLHTLLASGEDQVPTLWKALVALMTKTEGGTPGHVYCRWAMQLTFAAGRCIGKLSSTKEQREL